MKTSRLIEELSWLISLKGDKEISIESLDGFYLKIYGAFQETEHGFVIQVEWPGARQ